jgi:hypothetical protein
MQFRLNGFTRNDPVRGRNNPATCFKNRLADRHAGATVLALPCPRRSAIPVLLQWGPRRRPLVRSADGGAFRARLPDHLHRSPRSSWGANSAVDRGDGRRPPAAYPENASERPFPAGRLLQRRHGGVRSGPRADDWQYTCDCDPMGERDKKMIESARTNGKAWVSLTPANRHSVAKAPFHAARSLSSSSDG